MLTPKKSALLLGLALCLLLPACSNTPWAKNLERSLASDPALGDGSLFGQSSPGETAANSEAEAGIPSDFPAEIPRYPNAEFVSATQPSEQADLSGGTAASTQTRWTTTDSAEQVQQFYQDKFASDGWQRVQLASPESSPDAASPSNPPGAVSPSATASPSTEPRADGAIVAERDGLRVTVKVVPDSSAPSSDPTTPSSNTEFSIDYQFSNNATTAQAPSPSASGSSAPNASSGNAELVGPTPPAGWGNLNGNNSTASGAANFTAEEFTDVNQAPTQLQSYITDLAKLGALRMQASTNADGSAGTPFKPNAAITRREYARWLVTTNNLIYANQPARQIRLAIASDQPAFQDVPVNDPDFAAIQGLANTGLIPSPLSGDSTMVTFRPDAPLTRENLILWKVPVDLRKALPNATIEAVQQTWGFQDTPQIDPKALRAILADFENGDQSNIRRALGYTTLFQPDKPVSRAEAAAVLWFFGTQGDGLSAKDVLQPAQQGG